MKLLEPYALKRAGFMFAVMVPTLLILEYTGHTSNTATVLLAGVTAGISVVLFPDPEHLKRLEEAKKNEKTDK